jgi:hypothetical protein
VLDNACETAAEHAAEHPEDPLDVWRLVERYSCTPMQLRVATCLSTLLAKCNHHKQAGFAITPGVRVKYSQLS